MGLCGQRLCELPRENFKVFFIGQPALLRALCLRASGHSLPGFSLMGFTDIEHIDVGAVIELVSAQLSHCNDGEAGLHPPPLPILVHGNAVPGP